MMRDDLPYSREHIMKNRRPKIFDYKDSAVGTICLRRPHRDDNSNAPVVFWDRQTGSLEYNPYFVHVKFKRENKMTFCFLNNDTGADLPGDHEVDLNNAKHAYDGPPSSAQLCNPDSSDEHFGMLLFTRDYIKSINTPDYIAATGIDLSIDAVGDGKWPRSAGERLLTDSPVISALQYYIKTFGFGHLDSEQSKAIIELFLALDLPSPIIITES
jgi:hypothetical protein